MAVRLRQSHGDFPQPSQSQCHNHAVRFLSSHLVHSHQPIPIAHNRNCTREQARSMESSCCQLVGRSANVWDSEDGYIAQDMSTRPRRGGRPPRRLLLRFGVLLTLQNVYPIPFFHCIPHFLEHARLTPGAQIRFIPLILKFFATEGSAQIASSLLQECLHLHDSAIYTPLLTLFRMC